VVSASCSFSIIVRILIFELELKDYDVHESWSLIDILRRRGFHPYRFPQENRCLCVFCVIDHCISMHVKLSATH
jgi:hypothetical protein